MISPTPPLVSAESLVAEGPSLKIVSNNEGVQRRGTRTVHPNFDGSSKTISARGPNRSVRAFEI